MPSLTQQQTQSSWSPATQAAKSGAAQVQARPFVMSGGGGARSLEDKTPQLLDPMQVMLSATAPTAPPTAPTVPNPGIQRKEEPELDEPEAESKIQRKCESCGADGGNDDEKPPIQTKLTIGRPGDRYEQEADNIAAKVVSMPELAVQRSVAPLSSFMRTNQLQQKGGGGTATADFEQRLQASKGGGNALGDDVRSFMEPRFGADFSQVRVHTGATAVQLSKEVGAQAFTHGNDVYFNAGKYSPDSKVGKELLAHELTHTIQQTGGTLQRKSNKFSTLSETKFLSVPTGEVALQAKADNMHPIRSRVANVARSQLGMIEAHTDSGERREVGGKTIKVRKGGDQLLDIISTTSPKHAATEAQKRDILDVNVRVGTANQNRVPSWCGIFALWLHNQAGNQGGTWPGPWMGPTYGPEKLQFRSPGEKPAPGDVAYMKGDERHHATVVEVDGQNITTVEGNTGALSSILERNRDPSMWLGFARAVSESDDQAGPEAWSQQSWPDDFGADGGSGNFSESNAAGMGTGTVSRLGGFSGGGTAQTPATQTARGGSGSGGLASQGGASGKQASGQGQNPAGGGNKDAQAAQGDKSKKFAGDGAAGSTATATGGTAPKSAEADPDFKAAVGRTKAVGAAGKRHAPAGTKAQEAQAAAVSPPAEMTSKAQANQVGEMQQAETPGFNKAAFKQQLMERIKAAAPKTLEEADEFKEDNKLGAVKGDMTSKVKEEKAASQKPLEEKAKQAPNTSGIEPKPVTPLPAVNVGQPVATVGAEKAVPKPRGQAEVETPLKQEAQQADQQMADADITDEQLAKSNEPEFKSALSAKQAAKANAAEAPKGYRAEEQGELQQAQAEAGAMSQQKLQGMQGDRAQLFAQVAGQQTTAKSQDEQARTKVAGDVRKIYDETKGNVEKILNELDGKVTAKFDAGAAKAQKVFEDYIEKRMKTYKDKRYSGWVTGSARWLKDKLLGMPKEVDKFYVDGRNFYIQQMDDVIDQVVNLIAGELSRAKTEVAKRRQKVQDYLDKLPQDLKAVGKEAAGKIQSQFDSLEQSVDAKQDGLIDTLATKYNEKLKVVDAKIKKLKSANKGLVDKAVGAVKGVIATINKLKTMLLSVLKGAVSAIKGIIKDPIGFLGNLIGGIKKGFDNFVAKIWDHLQGGLVGWLTGALGGIGLQLPKDIFSLPGIFDLVMQVLGMSWNYVRTKAVKLMGEPVVKATEKTFEVFTLLQEKGPLGLWDYVKGQFSDLKEQVIDSIKNMVITKVITAGVKWIVSLLNPASAFVKACMLIYDVVMFFVNQGSQVLGLMKAVVDGVKAIASGSVGAVAKAIEGALVKSLPTVIGFLASLLGIGGLTGKVQKIIGKVRGRIDKAIDKILLKAKKLFKGKKGKYASPKDKDRAVQDGLKYLKKEERKFIKKNKISKEDATKVAQNTKRKNPIFKGIHVIDGGKDWDYDYTIQKTKAEGNQDVGKAEDSSDQIVRKEDISIRKSSVSDKKEWELVFEAKGITLGKVEMLLSDTPKKNPDDVFMVVNPSKDSRDITIHPPGMGLNELLKSEAKEAYKKTPTPGVEETREISRADIFSTSKKKGNTIDVSMYVKVEKQNIWWGTAIIYLDKMGNGKASAEHLLGAVDKTIYADKVSRLRIKERVGFTQVAIEETNKIYNQHEGKGDVPTLEAQLDEYNRFMFQITYAQTGSSDMAVRSTPFAKGRIPLGYREFTVEKMGDIKDINLSEEVDRFPYAKAAIISLAKQLGTRSVPTKILVTAKKAS